MAALDLLRHKDGATTAEIARATGWQTTASADSFSGTIAKKMDLLVASFKNEKGERVYKAGECEAHNPASREVGGSYAFGRYDRREELYERPRCSCVECRLPLY